VYSLLDDVSGAFEQLRVMSMPAGSRYVPLKDITVGGIIMLKNARPTEEEEIIEHVAAGGPKPDEEAEPEPPEPFEYIDDDAGK